MALYLGGRVETVRGDITRLDVEAIVNAANPSLLGGGGVDGAIHRAAGPGLLQECGRLGGARPGEVKATGGHALAARHVLHAVGPIWRGGSQREDETLASCYRGALALARDLGATSVAFPAISTGVYGFPLERAARIALGEIRGFVRESTLPRRVVLCLFSEHDLEVYDRLAPDLLGP